MQVCSQRELNIYLKSSPFWGMKTCIPAAFPASTLTMLSSMNNVSEGIIPASAIRYLKISGLGLVMPNLQERYILSKYWSKLFPFSENCGDNAQFMIMKFVLLSK